MAQAELVIRVGAARLQESVDQVAQQLLEQFPEAGLELIHRLILRALHDGAVFACGPTAIAGDGVAGFEIRLDAIRVFELCAAALRAGQGDRVAHGQSPLGND